MGGGRTTYGTLHRDRESHSTMVPNVLLPDSSLLTGNAQQRTLAPCVSLPDSWATDGENWPLVLLLLLDDLSRVLRTQGPMRGFIGTQCDAEAKGIDGCNLESSQPSGTP